MAGKMEKRGKIYICPTTEAVPTESLGEYLLSKLQENKEHILQIDGYSGESLNNRELLENSVKLANFLHTFGIEIGDRIAIAAENRLDWLIPVCAALYLGAVVVPYNPIYTEWEFEKTLNISKPRIVFVSRRTKQIFLKLLPNLSWPVELIELNYKPFGEQTIGSRTLTDILDGEKSVNLLKPLARFDDSSKHAAVVLCSSGTTGEPKGVTLSHRNLLAIITKLGKPDFMDLKHNEKTILFLPFFHGYAFGILLLGIHKPATTVVTPVYEPELLLSLIQKYRVNLLPIVPSIMGFLAKHPSVDKYDLRSVREIVCGAASFPRELVREVKARLGVKYVRNGYGMTELSMVTHFSNREDDDGSLGCPTPGMFSKVVHFDTGEVLDVDQVGEVCYKGDQVMLGYWNNPEATKQTIDKDGWLHTGDAGYYDEQNKLHIVDRLKELIKYKGYQVSPTEIEMILLSHPAVKDAAVTGKPDSINGEVPVAFIVKQPNVTLTVYEIAELVRKNLSPQKWLRGGVYFIDAIPRTPSGKAQRKKLQEMFYKM